MDDLKKQIKKPAELKQKVLCNSRKILKLNKIKDKKFELKKTTDENLKSNKTTNENLKLNRIIGNEPKLGKAENKNKPIVNNGLTASVITLGCKVNEYESQSILFQLKSSGYEIKEGLVPADIYIINTCAVTNTAEKKSRQVLSKIEKLNKNAKIVAVGCAVQNNPSAFLKNKNIVAITGNFGKHKIMNIIETQNRELPLLEDKTYVPFSRPIETRSRTYIKIQDGCDYFCSYCLIPYVRGRSRSRDLNDILDEIKAASAAEVVLTGINMSDYKIDGKLALKTLVKEVDKLGKRFRLSSLECNVLDDEMINILKHAKNFCPHFHLSLQSACNATLRRMNRRYTIEEFKEIVKKIKANFVRSFIATDIIVGFKGETDEEFNETLKNLEEIGFSFMHIFPYSERTGTAASKMVGAVDKAVTKAREKKLQALNSHFIKENLEKNLHSVHKVLIEEVHDGVSMGYTENYIYTYIEKSLNIGKIVDIKITKIYNGSVIGELIDNK